MRPFFEPDSPQLTLRPKETLAGRCDVSAILPSAIASLSRADIGGIKLIYDSQPVRLDELFESIGNPSSNLVFEGDCSNVEKIGAGMDGGTIHVRGDVGSGLASQMKSGRIEVLGNCKDYLATGMRNGTVIVHGSAGDCVAGPGVGQRRGLQGGDCIVLGDVGSRIGERMRRGMIYVGGNAGDFGAAQMIAGTIIVNGQIGSNWAGGMRRGSIILSNPTTHEFAAELTSPREFELSYLPLVWRHLEGLFGDKRTLLSKSRWAMRQVGDRANQGLGEVLTLTRRTIA